jgi:mRNA interferase MazF
MGWTMIQRGDVVYANLDPATGSEANKTRPVLVVSRTNANTVAQTLGRGVVTVVPLTTNTARIYDFQVFIDATDVRLPADSKAQIEQIRAIDVTRLGQTIGHLGPQKMSEVDAALRLHLQL